MTQKQIEIKYHSLRKKAEKIKKEQESFRENIKDECEHSITHEWQQDVDDGYGKWWKVNRERCLICGTTVK